MQLSKFLREGWNRCRVSMARDEGSASVEFLTLGMLLTVPLVYLVLTLGQLQAASLAVEGAARQAARVIAAADSHEDGMQAAEAAVTVALADVGLEADGVTVQCAPEPDDCTSPGGTVQVAVQTVVTLPLVPAALGLDEALAVPMGATALQPVSRFA